MLGGVGNGCAAAVRGMVMALLGVMVLVGGWGSEVVEVRIWSRFVGACCLHCGAARGWSVMRGSHMSLEEIFQHRLRGEEEEEVVVVVVVVEVKMKARDAQSCAAVSPMVGVNLTSSERPWLALDG